MGSCRAMRQEVLTVVETYIWFRHGGDLCRLQRVWCKKDGFLGGQKDCHVVLLGGEAGQSLLSCRSNFVERLLPK